VIVCLIVLAGCSGKSLPAQTRTVTATPSSSAVLATPSEANPIAAEIDADQYPACKYTVGLPTATVVRSYDATKKALDVRCITGTSSDSDHTGGGMTPCDPLDPASTPIYYWMSTATGNPDQHVYAAKKGGVVLIVPDETADEFLSIGGGLAGVVLAAGSC
jgi:hypothetical protein